ncbi:hypothetical protein TNCV_2289591 [Trichonephila clavipes]|uniref:Uncharacterized protein n=1 Tax=Trichonephila clavipes TaxID=2585209 RepID=A0A8X6RNX4_TRICX|nr:hypothetical protein TNCV_2289591 [Trichonephila clavipes]
MDSLAKMAVECLPGNSSTNSSKVMSKLRSHCPPIVVMHLKASSNPMKMLMLLGDLPSDRNSSLELISQLGDYFRDT